METKDVKFPELGEIRPRFQIYAVKETPAEIIIQISKFCEDLDYIETKIIADHIDLKVGEADRHYWSPVLHITAEEVEYSHHTTRIRCLIGPNQGVWAMFVLMYASVGILTLFGGMYGIIQWQMDRPAPLLWCFPVAFVITLMIIFSARFGQKKGRDQTITLLNTFFNSIREIETEMIKSS